MTSYRCQAIKAYQINKDLNKGEDIIVVCGAAATGVVNEKDQRTHLCRAHHLIHETGGDLQIVENLIPMDQEAVDVLRGRHE